MLEESISAGDANFSFHIPPKKEAHFQGFYEVTLSTKSEQKRKKGRACRDSAGRVRMDFEIEVSASTPSVTVSYIYDVEAAKSVVLNHHARTATVTDEPGAQEATPKTHAAPDESAERKLIHGIECIGRSGPTPDGGVAQGWVSEELGIVVAWDSETPRTKLSLRFTDLQTTEPDAALFQVPYDYKILGAE